MTDITDGTSTTLMVGERPPSPNFNWGWWDSAVSPAAASRDMDTVMGVAELGGTIGPSGPLFSDDETIDDNQDSCNGVYVFKGLTGLPCYDSDCDAPWASYRFTPSNFCDFYHFWSNHPRGAMFCFADGSVRFLPYTIADTKLSYGGTNNIPMMNALATRAAGEPDPRVD